MFCCGTGLSSAFRKFETVQHVARLALVAEQLGGPKLLDRQEVDELFKAPARYGIQSNSKALPGCPITADELPAGDKITVTREELIALIDEAVRAAR